MFQTILAFAVLLVGLAGVAFHKRLASSHGAFTLWAFGFDPYYFDPTEGRAGFILAGLAFSIMGLLIATWYRLTEPNNDQPELSNTQRRLLAWGTSVLHRALVKV